MKVGLFLSGHFRNAPIDKSNFSQFIDTNDEVNVYIAAWDNQNYPSDDYFKNSFGNRLKQISVFNMNDYLKSKPKDYHRDIYYPHNPKSPLVDGTLDKMYLQYECFKSCLREDFFSYDVIIRARLDADFRGKLKIPYENNSDGIHVNSYAFSHKNLIGSHHFSTNLYQWANTDNVLNKFLSPMTISTHLLWGSPKYMFKYFQYYNHIIPILNILTNRDLLEYYNKNSEYSFMHESLISYWLLKWPYFKNNVNPFIFKHDDDYDVDIHMDGNFSLSNGGEGRDFEYYALRSGVFQGHGI